MASAQFVGPERRPVQLTLSPDEADTLVLYLFYEKWPKNETYASTLNDIYFALREVFPSRPDGPFGQWNGDEEEQEEDEEDS